MFAFTSGRILRTACLDASGTDLTVVVDKGCNLHAASPLLQEFPVISDAVSEPQRLHGCQDRSARRVATPLRRVG